MEPRLARFRGRLILLWYEEILGAAEPLPPPFGAAALAAVPDPGRDDYLPGALRRLLAEQKLPPKQAFYVGATWTEANAAEQAGLALFKPFSNWFATD
jgi:hypothetical protein